MAAQRVLGVLLGLLAAAAWVDGSSGSTEARGQSGSQEWKKAFGGQHYDVIVLGTGMKECLLSGLLSKAGRKVLHLDRNSYYGGSSACCDLARLQETYGGAPPDEALTTSLGNPQSYYVDQVPKLMIIKGKLATILMDTGAHRHMQFRRVDGALIMKGGELHTVPTTAKEATTSPLVPLQDRLQAGRFFAWINRYKADDPATHTAGVVRKTKLNLQHMSGETFLQYWQLQPATVEVAMHGVALYADQSYLTHPASELVRRMQLYRDSLMVGGSSGEPQPSPFLYPLYGMGELPQAFSRLSSVFGGTFLLDRSVDEVLYDGGGGACGVRCGEEKAFARCVIGDPSYFPAKVKTSHHIVRVLALMKHPLHGTEDKGSCQVIVPGRELGREHDVYVLAVDGAHEVCPKDMHIAALSTVVEGPLDGLNVKQIADRELGSALAMVHPAERYFIEVVPCLEPTSNGFVERTFVTSSYDASSHVEGAVDEVASIYYRITGSWPEALLRR
ncbi:GDP dissociation inhibitor [Pavlovales sp. CCMP2436]|nr:GDP dissociation inhibitor [Pavlovales sp. CCMP2436]